MLTAPPVAAAPAAPVAAVAALVTWERPELKMELASATRLVAEGARLETMALAEESACWTSGSLVACASSAAEEKGSVMTFQRSWGLVS